MDKVEEVMERFCNAAIQLGYTFSLPPKEEQEGYDDLLRQGGIDPVKYPMQYIQVVTTSEAVMPEVFTDEAKLQAVKDELSRLAKVEVENDTEMGYRVYHHKTSVLETVNTYMAKTGMPFFINDIRMWDRLYVQFFVIPKREG